MKVFFEEYGLVLIVTVIVAGMLLFAQGFEEQIFGQITSQWEQITISPDGNN